MAGDDPDPDCTPNVIPGRAVAGDEPPAVVAAAGCVPNVKVPWVAVGAGAGAPNVKPGALAAVMLLALSGASDDPPAAVAVAAAVAGCAPNENAGRSVVVGDPNNPPNAGGAAVVVADPNSGRGWLPPNNVAGGLAGAGLPNSDGRGWLPPNRVVGALAGAGLPNSPDAAGRG